jgi:ParB/RepB/Spo0J family partition protein
VKISIDKFIISSDFREEAEDIGDLAHSIYTTGLIQPIIVDITPEGTYDIVAGRRRFRALAEYLKLTELEEGVHFLIRTFNDDLVVQFSENFQRKDHKPLETARLVQAIHTKQQALHGTAIRSQKVGWSIADTAQLLNRDTSFISRLLTIAEHPDLVEDCTSLRDALTTIEKAKAAAISNKVKKARSEKGTEKLQHTKIETYIKELKLCPAEDFLQTLKPESVDFIFTDPPFAIDIDEIAGSDDYDAYEDNPQEILNLIELLVPKLYRVLKPNKYIVIWTAFEHFSWLQSQLLLSGFTVSNIPIVWVKTNAVGRSRDPSKVLGSVCEIAVYGWKGQQSELTQKGRGNVFPHPTVRTNRIHIAQKPESLVIDILGVFSLPGDLVLDTFSGSGSTLRACFKSKRAFTGCEKREDHLVNSVLYTRQWAEEQNENPIP